MKSVRLVALMIAGSLLGGCAGAMPVAITTGLNGAATVTFESVDGPPPQVFDRLVRVLESESAGRNITVVSRETRAAYRVRSYLAAQIRGGRTVIAWVWDVYDRDQQRALRLSGEVPAGKPGRDAWAAADDTILRNIAQSGLNGLSGLLSGSPAPSAPAPVETRPGGPAIADATGAEAATRLSLLAE